MEEELIELRDETGIGPELLKFEDVILPAFFKKTFGGIPLKEKLEQIKAIEYHEGDVLLCSHPKTGTHWMTNILAMLQLDADKLDEAISVTPLLVDVLPEVAYKSLNGPRIINSHFDVERLPTELQKKAKTVFVLRNPKDACVSFYHHLKGSRDYATTQSFGSMVQQYLYGPIACGTYSSYLKKLHNMMQNDNGFKPYIIYYEDIKKDGVRELRKLQEYLGLSHPDSHLEAVLNKCDINKLRDDVNEGRVKSMIVNESGKSVLYRKGEIGDWKNHFTVAQNEMFDSVWSTEMEGLPFKFQYE